MATNLVKFYFEALSKLVFYLTCYSDFSANLQYFPGEGKELKALNSK